MDADSSRSTPTARRQRSLPPVPVDPDFRAGRPLPAIRKGGPAGANTANPRSVDTRISNLAASFPLFFFGAGCLAVALFIILEGSHAAIGRIPLWVPFIALGIIALAGGTLSVFAEPDEPPRDEPEQEPAISPRAPRPRPVPSDRIPHIRAPANTGVTQIAARPSAGTARKDVAEEKPPEPSPPPVPPPSPAPAPTISPNVEPIDDTDALLREIDSIEAAIHTSYRTPRVPSIAPPVNRPVPAQLPSIKPPVPTVAKVAALGPSTKAAPRTASEGARQVARCVGCGSVILHSGSPSKCQVCGEPLCSECRDRSIAEGKPNLCPLCSLLDSVHSRGPSAPPPRSGV